MTGHSGEHTRRTDAIDELAALFLTEQSPAADRAALREPAFRELLIVGNMPVRGGVWLTPYADAIARENGPTALVRFDLEPPTLELLRSERAQQPANGATHAANRTHSASSQPASFKDAVLRAADEVAVWIIRGPSNSQPADLLTLSFDRVTILTSADSAAIVAAYQIIKEIVAASEEDDRIDLPRIALAIAGAEKPDADDVIRRMNETATAQLGVNVELAHCLTRMDAGIRCETFASFAESNSPTVRELLDWLDDSESATQWKRVDDEELHMPLEEHAGADDRPPLRLAPMIDDVNDEVDLGPNDDDPRDEADARELLLADEDLTADHIDAAGWIEQIKPAAHEEAKPSRNGVRLPPKPAAQLQCEPKSSQPAAARDEALLLASFVAGLSPLPVRCPAHEDIELAADEHGRVHVLAREGLLRELRVVETWAKAHRQLIAMACTEHRLDATDEVVCHLFTDTPATLADLHNTGLHLHVLAQVKVGNETAWYAAPLSR